ncbi:MAG: hypothetical protein ACI8ZX_002315 [Planctomycetota bacterium]|jgi:hypothetical protein
MKIRILYTFLIVLFFSSAYSQKKDKLYNAEGENAIYKKEWSVGFRFHTNALSAFFEHVWIKDIKKRKVLQINLFGHLDLRDKKSRSVYDLNKKYFYAKQNNFYSTQIMYGWRRVIANKSEVSGVKLSMTYMGGFTLGVLKPYYLEILRENSQTTDEKYLGTTAEDFLDKNVIIGAAEFGVGNNKLEFMPGLTAKVGLNFDFARKNSVVTSIEVGSQIDVFYKKVKIYVSKFNKPYILNLYLSVQIGKRS